MKLSDILADHRHYLRYEQGVAKTTDTHYHSQLQAFLRWLQASGYPEPTLAEFNTATLRRFLYHLGSRNLRPRTIRGAFHALRSLGSYLVQAGALIENPAASIQTPKLDPAVRKVVTEEEVRQLLAACERQANLRRVAFCRAVISVLCYAGLRRQELCDLKVSDVEEKALHVRHGKGDKARRVFVCEEGMNALREWLALRPKDCRHDWLFAYDRGRRIHHAGLHTLMEEIKARAGLREAKHIVPHSLRHNFATRLLRNGVDLESIRQTLGHSSLVITSQYLHTDETRLQEVAHLGALATPRDLPSVGGRGDRDEPRRTRLRRIASR